MSFEYVPLMMYCTQSQAYEQNLKKEPVVNKKLSQSIAVPINQSNANKELHLSNIVQLSRHNRKNTNSQEKLRLKSFEKAVCIVVMSPISTASESYKDIWDPCPKTLLYIQPLLAPRLKYPWQVVVKSVSLPLAKTPPLEEDWQKVLLDKEHKVSLDGTKEGLRRELDRIYKEKGYLESIDHFNRRISQLKKQLYRYKDGVENSVLVLSHKDVLQALTATTIFANGELANPLGFEIGVLKEDYVVIPKDTR